MGLAPIGCAPHYLWESNSARCVDEVNKLILGFNLALKYAVLELNRKLPDALFIFCDAFEGHLGSPISLQSVDHLFFQPPFPYPQRYVDGRIRDDDGSLLRAGQVRGPGARDGVQERVQPRLVGRVPPHNILTKFWPTLFNFKL